MSHVTLYDLLRQRAEERGERVAALAKRDGRYEPWSWRAIYERARAVGRALVREGVKPGDRVCIIAETSLDWIVCDLAVVGAGAATVPIYPAETPDGCQYVAADSGAVMVLAGDGEQVRKLRHVRARLPEVRRVVQLAGEPAAGDEWVVSLDSLLEAGGEARELEARAQAPRADDMATLIYTAGTTGRGKGVVLTHGNLLYEAEAMARVRLVGADDLQLLYLPLAHSLGKVLVVSWLATGHVLALAESPTAVMRNLLEVKPTFLAGVPRLFERIYGTIVQRALAAGAVTSRLFHEAAELSVRRGEAEARFRRPSLVDSLELAALRRLVMGRVAAGLAEALGGRMRFMISGGAPLSPKIAWLLRDAGLLVLEGYGLTETSAATTVNRPERSRIGSVGLPLAGTHVRIAADGEVLVKGPGVMREYWQDPQATREILDGEGWLRTGDVGFIDGGGYLHITDRKKDIIVTAGGKNVAPQNIENLLQSHPLISHVVVHGDRRKFLSALVTVDGTALRKLAAERGLGNGSYAELSQKREVRRAVEAVVAEHNQQVPPFEAVRRFKVLEHDFTIDSGELSPSLKVKRRVVYERYKNIFNGFYDEHY